MTGSTMPDQHRPRSETLPDIVSVSASECAGVTVVSITGEVDISNIDQLSATIFALPNSGPGLVVDLTDVRYIDSATVSLLHDLAMRLRQRAQRLVVVAAPASPPRRVLELTSLELTAALTDDLELAVRVILDETAPGSPR